MKLTIEQHAQIAFHLHGADYHLLRAQEIMGKHIPADIFSDIETARQAIADDILSRCEAVLWNDWPAVWTHDTYHSRDRKNYESK
jgi:hypothetical protein